MSSRFSDEQISSYFDGEASSEDLAEIERLLETSGETSDEAREEFAEYKKLSALLRDLPDESAPLNFSSIVNQKLKTVRSETSTVTSPSKGNRSRNSVWKFAGSLAVIAAVLLITVKLFDFGLDQRDELELADSGVERSGLLDRELSERTPLQSDESKQSVAESLNDTNRLGPSASGDAVNVGEKSRLKKEAIASQRAPIVALKPAVDATKPITTPQIGTANLVQQSNVPQSDEKRSELIFKNPQELKNADIGKMVTALEKTNEGITVVKLTVVDRLAGLKSLQVLLSRHKIPLDDETGKKSGSSQTPNGKSRKRKNVQNQSERLVAVYVEATPRQISAALGDMRDSDLFQKLHVRGPILTAQLNRYSRPQGFAGNSNPNSTASKSLTGAGRRAGSPGIGGSFKIQIGSGSSGKSGGGSKSPVEAKKPSDARQQQGLGSEKLADHKELDRISRQLELSLSPDVLTELSQSTGRTGRNSTGSSSTGRITIQGNLGGTSQQTNNTANSLRPDPLKVLFILVVNESDKPKASPSGKPAEPSKKSRTPKKSSGNGAA